jgi:hypothetical protein
MFAMSNVKLMSKLSIRPSPSPTAVTYVSHSKVDDTTLDTNTMPRQQENDARGID